jgi:hypothetical protein
MPLVNSNARLCPSLFKPVRPGVSGPFFVEVGMTTDSTFQDNMQRQGQAQDSVPSRPEPDSPSLNPDDPGKYDPLTTPDPGTVQRPEDWDDLAGRELPEADEQTPLSDDRR